MNDSHDKLIVRAIVGSAYLVAATILFVGIGVMLVSDQEPRNSGSLFLGGIFLTMVFFYITGLKTLSAVSREMKK